MALLLALQEAAVAAGETGAGTGTAASLRLLDLPPAWVLVMIVLPIFAAVSWIGYGRESLARGTRLALAGLRFGSLCLLLLVLSRPVEVQSREEVYPAEVLVLLDDSASMRRRDAYAGDAEERQALHQLVGRDPSGATRSELVREALDRELIPGLEADGYTLRRFAFSDTLTPLGSLDQLEGRGPATHLGDALAQALAAHRGRHVTDVLLVSDGRNNGGSPVLDVARVATAAGIPVHTAVVGDTRPERNAIVELVAMPPSVLEGDEVEITVRVLGRGLQGGVRAQVLLEELDPRGGDGDRPPRLVAEEELEITGDGQRLVLLAPPTGLDPGLSERRFRVSLPPLPGETLTDDNELALSVHVSRQKVRVLYVEGYPRWEYRKLKDLLIRSDSNVSVQIWLLSATYDFVQDHSADVPPLRQLPTTREELLDNYDVVILGDVPAAISDDPDVSAGFHRALVEFVEGGGGLLFQAGEFDNPRAYRLTPLEELLPVILPTSGVRVFDVDTTRQVHPLLEDPTAPHEIVRLIPEAATNRRLWEDEEGLQGFYWYLPVERAKPGSQVLLRHPYAGNSHGNHPLLVIGYYPAGRTMFLGLDSSWRWLLHFGKRYHERFWRGAVRWLALGRLRSGDRRFRIETPRSEFDLDERVTLEARVLDEDFQPSQEPGQEVRLSGPDGRPEVLTLTAVPDRAGLYRGAVEVDQPGLYRAWIEVGGERVSSTEFEVVLPSRENDNPAPDPETLASLSTLTGGRAVKLSELGELADEFPGDEERREPISSRLEDAWDTWWTLIAALVLLGAEWILRKRVELI